jgi:hypothetical protein
MQRFGFIVRGPGYVPAQHRAVLDSGQFATLVVGVSSIEAATQASREMVAAGVQLIELCGGFSADDADAVRRAVLGTPVGRVSYSPHEEEELSRMFA